MHSWYVDSSQYNNYLIKYNILTWKPAGAIGKQTKYNRQNIRIMIKMLETHYYSFYIIRY